MAARTAVKQKAGPLVPSRRLPDFGCGYATLILNGLVPTGPSIHSAIFRCEKWSKTTTSALLMYRIGQMSTSTPADRFTLASCFQSCSSQHSIFNSVNYLNERKLPVGGSETSHVPDDPTADKFHLLRWKLDAPATSLAAEVIFSTVYRPNGFSNMQMSRLVTQTR